MGKWFEYDPNTGIKTSYDYDEDTGMLDIVHSSDISAAVDYAKAISNTGAADAGIKAGIWRYAVIPPLAQIALRNKGLDIYSQDPTMINRVLQEIDDNFPWLKTTTKKHRVKNIRHV